MNVDTETIKQTLSVATEDLIHAREPAGYWQGRLSSSALATATAVFALSMANENKHKLLINFGLDWLSKNQNVDGGWGDSVISVSNLPTTMLCWAAFAAAQNPSCYKDTVAKAELWIAERAGSLKPESLIEAVNLQYGNDRTFSAPILTMCALTGRLGEGRRAWSKIKALPFELAVCPHQLFKWLRLPVVSYALPALIAVGQVNYHKNRPANLLVRLVRGLTKRKTLKVLQKIQPAAGGFLEAVPLTSFVVMSLIGAGESDNCVVSKGIEFICNSVRADGSWPIDTNLTTWLTTLSINALSVSSNFKDILLPDERKSIQEWLLSQQYRRPHPYTYAPPGGWAWTDLPGGVPDTDDTAGALIALRNLDLIDGRVIDAAKNGIKWLLGLQNKDGGFPTFCRGRLNLPFDRSAPDLTAHAINAMAVWRDKFSNQLGCRINQSIKKGIKYLANVQNDNGTWIPLWFGNESTPNQENPVYGTSRVLTGLQTLSQSQFQGCAGMMDKAVGWLLSAQNTDGGWGGAKAVESSIEETALAVDALAGSLNIRGDNERLQLSTEKTEHALWRGVGRLVEKTERGTKLQPAPIGLYFAKLWYFEELYPAIFTISALNKTQRILCHSESRRAGKESHHNGA
ncbi:MAG: squalene--hopene cyclase [Planctomycetota bacterium]|nr:MAG: squalene--hopene cyclase [Planctomycetota bacterium]